MAIIFLVISYGKSQKHDGAAHKEIHSESGNTKIRGKKMCEINSSFVQKAEKFSAKILGKKVVQSNTNNKKFLCC